MNRRIVKYAFVQFGPCFKLNTLHSHATRLPTSLRYGTGGSELAQDVPIRTFKSFFLQREYTESVTRQGKNVWGKNVCNCAGFEVKISFYRYLARNVWLKTLTMSMKVYLELDHVPLYKNERFRLFFLLLSIHFHWTCKRQCSPLCMVYFGTTFSKHPHECLNFGFSVFLCDLADKL